VLFNTFFYSKKASYNNNKSEMSRLRNVQVAIVNKVRSDEFWLSGSKRHFYALDQGNIAKLEPSERPNIVRALDHFVELFDDDATKKFIHHSVELSDSILIQTWHNLAKAFLSLFYTQTDINGYLGRGSMFVLSEEHFRFLIDKAGIQSPSANDKLNLGKALIDLGAGDGCPTQSLSPFFDETHVTETSWAMRNILAKKGFKVLEVEDWSSSRPGFYDMVSCLNLLDRCEKPTSLLTEIKRALKPNGLLLVALVLPFHPYVEFGADNSHKPLEKLPISGSTFEAQVMAAINYFESENFNLKSWTRVPYLCQGDMAQSVYMLDDAVFLLEKV